MCKDLDYIMTIEILKKNEKPLGLLSIEQQKILRSLPREIQFFTGYQWANLSEGENDWGFTSHSTYRIKPDYQPERESKFVECDVYMHKGRHMYIHRSNNEDYDITDAVSYVNFYGFLYKDGTINASPLLYKDVKSNVPPVAHHFPDSIAIRPIKVLFRKGEM